MTVPLRGHCVIVEPAESGDWMLEQEPAEVAYISLLNGAVYRKVEECHRAPQFE
ncbi:MAG TPA: hypothetical protein VJ773_05610 [Gemmatimonadales bacterium]|nr:hypothetical protein [Gemmatimonadales bacterium]